MPFNALRQLMPQPQQRTYPTPQFNAMLGPQYNQADDHIFANPPNQASQQGIGFDQMGSPEAYYGHLLPWLNEANPLLKWSMGWGDQIKSRNPQGF